jgi:hypothetical protein
MPGVHPDQMITRQWRALPVAAVLAMALGGCLNAPAEHGSPLAAGASTPPSSGAPTAAPPADEGDCPASGTVVSAGPVDAAMGSRAVTLSLVNCGSTPYTVEGYPELRLLDEQQAVIPVTVAEEPDPIGGKPDWAPTPVTLAPGQTAQAVLLWRNTVEVGLDDTSGTYLGVTTATGDTEQVIELDVDMGTTGRLTAGPWRAPA